MPHPATGAQYTLRAATPQGVATATVTAVAAGLREYALNGIDLVEGFAVDAVPPLGAGIVLMPWPNRIRDGVWQHGDHPRRLALTEPVLQNAIHGLLTAAAYQLVEQTDASVTLAATVYPQSGYPFQLDTTVTYTLGADGLTVRHGIHNVGGSAAPVALGTHPYLKIGDVPTGDLLLRLAVGTHIDVDARLNPVGESPVAGSRFDLGAGARVHDLDLDDAFTATAAPTGRHEHSLTAPDGRRVVLWGDQNMAYVQVFTPRNFPVRSPSERTTTPSIAPDLGNPADAASPTAPFGQAVAIEPMTAPANAFNSGQGLRWLEPGESWTVDWGITPTGFAG